MKNKTKTNVHAHWPGRVLRGQGCCLLVVRQSYYVSIWWTTEGRRERPDRRQANMRAETTPKKTREHHNAVVGFCWIRICLVFRGYPVWHRLATYIIHIVAAYPISWDITMYDISIYYSIHTPNFGTDIEISYAVDKFLDREYCFFPSYDCKINGYLPGAFQKQWHLLGNMYVRP